MVIYYSAQGNSYNLAKKISERTDEQAIPLVLLQEHPELFNLEKEKRIGIVFSVCYGEVPKSVDIFLQKARLNPCTYFYSVATCDSYFGNSLYHLREILKRRRCNLSYGAVFFRIANNASTWKKKILSIFYRLEGENKLAEQVAKAVQWRRIDYTMMESSLLRKLISVILLGG